MLSSFLAWPLRSATGVLLSHRHTEGQAGEDMGEASVRTPRREAPASQACRLLDVGLWLLRLPCLQDVSPQPQELGQRTGGCLVPARVWVVGSELGCWRGEWPLRGVSLLPFRTPGCSGCHFECSHLHSEIRAAVVAAGPGGGVLALIPARAWARGGVLELQPGPWAVMTSQASVHTSVM